MKKTNRSALFRLVLTLLLALVMSLAWGMAMGQDVAKDAKADNAKAGKTKANDDEFVLEESCGNCSVS